MICGLPVRAQANHPRACQRIGVELLTERNVRPGAVAVHVRVVPLEVGPRLQVATTHVESGVVQTGETCDPAWHLHSQRDVLQSSVVAWLDESRRVDIAVRSSVPARTWLV